jgi:hypothetical protein
MRTTITLTPEADSLVQKAMRERGLSFKDAVNEAIIAGLGGPARPFETPTFRLGRARRDLDHALSLAGELEDEHLLRKQELGK